MFSTITVQATLYQGLSNAPGVSEGATDAFWADWSSWSAIVDSLSTPLGFRLGAWLVLGWVIGIGLSFLVRNLGRGRAFVGGTLGGLLAAGVFLMASDRLGEKDGHLAAAAILVSMMGLMVVRARRRTGAASAPAREAEAAPEAEAACEAEAAPADQSTPAPAPDSQSAPAADDSSPQPEAAVSPRASKKAKAGARRIFRIKSSNAEDWMKGQT